MTPSLGLNDSVSGWREGERRRIWLAGSGLTALVAIVTGYALGGFFDVIDSQQYRWLVERVPVLLPFASRQLAPLLVRGLMGLGLSELHGFLLLGLLSLAVLVAAVVWLLLQSAAPRWMLTAILGLFFWGQQFNGLALPDLPYAALVAVFLLLLWRRANLAAACMLLPLAIARESTILLLLCLLAAGWRRLRWQQIVAAAVSLGTGFYIVRRLTGSAVENHERIPPALYMLAKMPWNAARNLFGLSPWANVYPTCQVPVARFALHLGPVHEVGYCHFDPAIPMETLASALVSFGLLPLLLLWVRNARPAEAMPQPAQSAQAAAPAAPSLLLRFCVVYGVLSYAIAAALGASLGRLYEYAWPAFFVALPLLVGRSRSGFRSPRAAIAFVAVSLALSWSAARLFAGPLLCVGIAGWALGWYILRTAWRPLTESSQPGL